MGIFFYEVRILHICYKNLSSFVFFSVFFHRFSSKLRVNGHIFHLYKVLHYCSWVKTWFSAIFWSLSFTNFQSIFIQGAKLKHVHSIQRHNNLNLCKTLLFKLWGLHKLSHRTNKVQKFFKVYIWLTNDWEHKFSNFSITFLYDSFHNCQTYVFIRVK